MSERDGVSGSSASQMRPDRPRIAVTGANGYIGRRVLAALARRGSEALPMVRSPPGGAASLRFDISDDRTHHCPSGVSALIHLAANTSNAAYGVAHDEVEACRCLAQSAHDQGARFVFVSSQTARHDAPTSYGLTKWECERATLAFGGVIIRLGLVYGSSGAGLFGQLLGFVRRLPAYPIFLPPPLVQPVHIDDVAEWLVDQALCQQPQPCSQVGAWPPVRFDRFLSAISRHRLRVLRVGIPVPLRVITAMMRVARAAGLKLAAGERLLSLANLPAMDTRTWTRDFGPRSLDNGMHPSGTSTRRKLMLDARPVFRAVCGPNFSNQLLRPYVRIIGRADAPGPGSLSQRARVELAMAIAESSQTGARQVLMADKTSGWASLALAFLRAAGIELKDRALRLFSFCRN